MNTELLLKLADLLYTVPEEQFQYETWATSEHPKVVMLGSCGTTACALGWATTMKETDLSFWTVDKQTAIQVKHSTGVMGTTAAQVAFDLDVEEAQALFLPCEYYAPLDDYSPEDGASAKEVADWIRTVVVDWQSRNE